MLVSKLVSVSDKNIEKRLPRVAKKWPKGKQDHLRKQRSNLHTCSTNNYNVLCQLSTLYCIYTVCTHLYLQVDNYVRADDGVVFMYWW
jgi:hypothetical protein